MYDAAPYRFNYFCIRRLSSPHKSAGSFFFGCWTSQRSLTYCESFHSKNASKKAWKVSLNIIYFFCLLLAWKFKWYNFMWKYIQSNLYFENSNIYFVIPYFKRQQFEVRGSCGLHRGNFERKGQFEIKKQENIIQVWCSSSKGRSRRGER